MTNARLLIAGLLMAGASGCGAGYDGPPVYEVGGLVTYRGEPCAGCTVILSPTDASDPALSAQGTTDGEGRFAVSTSDRMGNHYEPGAAEGRYAVAITKWETTVVSGDTPPRNLLPQKYARPTTSRLEAVVTPEGPNDFRYDL